MVLKSREKNEPLHSAGTATIETSMEAPQKIKNATHMTSNPTEGYTPKGHKTGRCGRPAFPLAKKWNPTKTRQQVSG
jgi:hypothetical protein